MLHVRRRNLLLLSAAILIVRSLESDTASADTLDLPVLVGILTQTTSMVSTMANMLISLKNQLQRLDQMVQHLDPSSFQQVIGLIEQSEFTYDSLTSDVNGMGYRLTAVNNQFHRLFPSSYAGTPPSNFAAIRSGWHNEVLASSQVAARSQASLSALQDNTTQVAAILANSRDADGVVAQLQGITQLLGIMVQQNNTVIQSLTTTGRVIADMAAAQASDHQLSAEQRSRSLANYTDKGDPVPPMALP
jgi:conjugal transfer/entry exclusion protein